MIRYQVEGWRYSNRERALSAAVDAALKTQGLITVSTLVDSQEDVDRLTGEPNQMSFEGDITTDGVIALIGITAAGLDIFGEQRKEEQGVGA